MTSRIPDLQDVVERLEKVEKQNRMFERAGFLILALGCAVLGSTSLTTPRTGTVEKRAPLSLILSDKEVKAP